MSLFPLIEKPVENHQQTDIIGMENYTQTHDSYGFVDEVLDGRAKSEKPVVLFNITLDNKHKKELVRQIKGNYGKVSLFLADDENDFVNNDYPLKCHRFISNVKEVDVCNNYGEPFNPSDINIIIRFKSKEDFRKIDSESGLTRREEEIMNLLSQGLLYKEIAKSMNISFQTVKSHLKHIYTKLQVSNRTEAILKHLQTR